MREEEMREEMRDDALADGFSPVWGTLDLATGGSALEAEHARLIGRLLARGAAPERTEADVLEQGVYHPEAIALARGTWRQRMIHEHASAAVFSGLLPQLMAAGAPLEFKTIVLRCSMDEVRHAALCAQVVAHLGGDPRAEQVSLRPRPVPWHDDCSPRVGALRNTLFASLSETVSVGLLTTEREHTTEPFIARVLRQLAGDESLHARLGWTFLGVTLPTLDAQERDALRRYLPVALQRLYDEMCGAMPLRSTPIAPEVRASALRLGYSPADQGRELLHETFVSIILPQLDALGLEASASWAAPAR